ncbi:MAG: hypothetical protein ACR2PR_12165 [Pseudohongiellaceae bacterium]
MKIDSVKLMRELRAKINRETRGMTLAEQQEYFREHSRSVKSLLGKEPDKDQSSGA